MAKRITIHIEDEGYDDSYYSTATNWYADKDLLTLQNIAMKLDEKLGNLLDGTSLVELENDDNEDPIEEDEDGDGYWGPTFIDGKLVAP